MKHAAADVLRGYPGEKLMADHVVLERAKAARRGERSKGINEIGDGLARQLSPFLEFYACEIIARGIFKMLIEKSNSILEGIARRWRRRRVGGVQSIEEL